MSIVLYIKRLDTEKGVRWNLSPTAYKDDEQNAAGRISWNGL